ncbi:MAG TPA: hypothetical protein VFT50_03570 [Baekduia sp.]|nr:hypothetical protein [Baekduia sp.]
MPTTLDVEDDRVVVHLSGPQAVMALARQVSVPLGDVRSVSTVPDGGAVDVGWRVGGTAIPRRLRFGRFRKWRGGPRTFAAVYCGHPAVVIETTGGDWDRVVVTVDDADAAVRRVRDAGGGRS